MSERRLTNRSVCSMLTLGGQPISLNAKISQNAATKTPSLSKVYVN